MCRIARSLGLFVLRNFVSWSALEPAPGKFFFERIDKQFDLSRKYGITDPVLCIVDPPVWALKGAARNVNYQAFDGDSNAWARFRAERHRAL